MDFVAECDKRNATVRMFALELVELLDDCRFGRLQTRHRIRAACAGIHAARHVHREHDERVVGAHYRRRRCRCGSVGGGGRRRRRLQQKGHIVGTRLLAFGALNDTRVAAELAFPAL